MVHIYCNLKEDQHDIEIFEEWKESLFLNGWDIDDPHHGRNWKECKMFRTYVWMCKRCGEKFKRFANMENICMRHERVMVGPQQEHNRQLDSHLNICGTEEYIIALTKPAEKTPEKVTPIKRKVARQNLDDTQATMDYFSPTKKTNTRRKTKSCKHCKEDITFSVDLEFQMHERRCGKKPSPTEETERGRGRTLNLQKRRRSNNHSEEITIDDDDDDEIVIDDDDVQCTDAPDGAQVVNVDMEYVPLRPPPKANRQPVTTFIALDSNDDDLFDEDIFHSELSNFELSNDTSPPKDTFVYNSTPDASSDKTTTTPNTPPNDLDDDSYVPCSVGIIDDNVEEEEQSVTKSNKSTFFEEEQDFERPKRPSSSTNVLTPPKTNTLQKSFKPSASTASPPSSIETPSTPATPPSNRTSQSKSQSSQHTPQTSQSSRPTPNNTPTTPKKLVTPKLIGFSNRVKK
ncbi:dvc-1 [Acrasis kona]|uniref:Dvc-1 n=1 Tax=Acrasis kona TaxID=1008807 RepID=A0AAW2YU73_9EUKA